MGKFLDYCYEANANGADFENLVAKNVQKWIELNNLQNTFSSERFQTVSEDNGNREEDYSDVIVYNHQNDSEFFIECKKNNRDNILTTQFDIVEGCHLIPVKKVNREPSKSLHLKQLAADIEKTKEWQKFSNFMLSVFEDIIPINLWLNKVQATKEQLLDFISRYNERVNQGKTESDSKMFDVEVIRDTTRNQLLVALMWRIYDASNTWDIVHLKDIPYFGQLISDHYQYGKAGEVKYIQIEDNCYCFDDDPLNTTATKFPVDLKGQFDLKFTPRFGTGSMYLTPRSKLTEKRESNFTFVKG